MADARDAREQTAGRVGTTVGALLALIVLRLLRHTHMEVKNDVASLVLIAVLLLVVQHGFRLMARWTAKPNGS